MRRLTLILLLAFSMVAKVLGQDTTPITTEEPAITSGELTAVPASTQPQNIFGDALSELINLRNDIELLATARKGTVRPDGWNGNLDVTNVQLPLMIRSDIELLLADQLGFSYPAGWLGIVLSDARFQVRDMRHDIELLADALMGAGIRPDNWSGIPDPLWMCSRSTQTLVEMLERGDTFLVVADGTSPDYCAIVELQAVQFVQQRLFTADASTSLFTAAVKTSLPGSIVVNTDFAVGFLDRGAGQRVGVIPNGTLVTPVGRSTSQFSKMVLFQGQDFLVFADYSGSSLTEDEFKILADAGTPATFCNAEWCSG